MEKLDGRTVELIEAGVMAGAYRALARTTPGAERGLLKMAARHHMRGTALCGEISAAAGLNTRSVAQP